MNSSSVVNKDSQYCRERERERERKEGREGVCEREREEGRECVSDRECVRAFEVSRQIYLYSSFHSSFTENHDVHVYNIFMSYSRIYQIKAGRWSHLEMINNPAVETHCRVYQRYKQTLSEC